MKIRLTIIFVAVLTVGAFGQFRSTRGAAVEKKCFLAKSALPAIAKLKLGMSGREIKKLYPAEKNNLTEFPAAIKPTRKIDSVSFSVENNELRGFSIIYKPVWKSVEEFTEDMKKSLNIPVPDDTWEKTELPPSKGITARCKDFSISLSASDLLNDFSFALTSVGETRF